MKVSRLVFSTASVRAGFLWALAAAPIALALAAGTTHIEAIVQLFFGSKWFAFKAVVGAVEILVFGLAAGITEQRLAAIRGHGDGTAV